MLFQESLTPLYPTNIPPPQQQIQQQQPIVTTITPEYANGDHSRNENEIEATGKSVPANDESQRWRVSIEDFNLLTIIGRGSYAKVVQAEHRVTKQIYAIKIIKKEMFNEDEDIEWVQTEKSVFETASNHPFLVGLHSCFQVSTPVVSNVV